MNTSSVNEASSASAHEAVLDELAAAWCARDLARFTPDATYHDMAREMAFEGHEGLTTHATEAWAALTDLAYRLLHRHATAAAGAAHWQVRGTLAQPAAVPGAAPAVVQVEGLALYEFRDGRIARMTHAWNLADWTHRGPG